MITTLLPFLWAIFLELDLQGLSLRHIVGRADKRKVHHSEHEHEQDHKLAYLSRQGHHLLFIKMSIIQISDENKYSLTIIHLLLSPYKLQISQDRPASDIDQLLWSHQASVDIPLNSLFQSYHWQCLWWGSTSQKTSNNPVKKTTACPLAGGSRWLPFLLGRPPLT